MSQDAGRASREAGKQAVTSLVERALLDAARGRAKSQKRGWRAAPAQVREARELRFTDPVDGDVTLANGVRQAWLDERDTYNHGLMRVVAGVLVLMPTAGGQGGEPEPGAAPIMSHKERRELEAASSLSDAELEGAALQAMREYEEAVARLDAIKKAKGK